MARFYERGNVDEARGEYRIVVRTPDGKRVEIDLPRREARHSLSLASMVIWQHFLDRATRGSGPPP